MANESTATVNPGPATPTAPAAPSQPASPQFTVPEGKVLVDRGEYETHQRYAEQVKGFTPFYERARKSGFARPEDFDGLDPLVKSIKSKGLTLEQAHRAFFAELGEETPPAGAPDPRSSFDPKQFREELMNETRVELATERHNDAIKGVPDLLTKAAKDVLGKGASDHDVELYSGAIASTLAGMREDKAHAHKFMYPEGHPLRGSKWAPYSQEVVAEVAAAFKKKREAAAGAAKVQAAGAVRAGTTIAAPNTGGGAPDKNSDRDPGGLPKRDTMLAKAEAKLAARGR